MDTIDTALYFPYIRVPPTTWFTQVLLYWDAAASIVPYREPDKTELGSYMSQLIEAGLLHPVSPDQAFQENVHTFDQGFLQMLDSRKPGPPDKYWPETPIHKDQISLPLFKELGERGLAIDYKQPIREAAYFRWINRGRPLGDPEADWFAAELEGLPPTALNFRVFAAIVGDLTA